jgi:asparagine synthase (glutamine-hydrolysing)
MRAGTDEMMQEFGYRGPDEKGSYLKAGEGIALGHVRLSIIDLSGGQQPMSSADGRLTIVFNGEIYNYAEERRALEQSGCPFRTQNSDTEVILALYQRYGTAAWNRLRGQFAFGLWDAQERCVYLVRDRLGEKPLVYSWQNNVLYFASEVKALLRAGIPAALNPSTLSLHLLMQHLPAPFSLFENIQRLPPGYALKATASGIELKAYWKPPATLFPRSVPESQLVDQFRYLFEEAVRLCTVSDVPIGTYLSGGLDSTSVTWAAMRARSGPLHSFAIFNRENHEQHPDWKYAQEAAASLHTQHHNVFYDLSDLTDLIPELIEKTDEPFQGPTGLVSLFLSKFTRQQVKVVLTGSGGDELLGGYQSYYQRVLRTQRLWQRADRWIPGPARRLLGSVLGHVHPLAGRLGLAPGQRRIVANVAYHQEWFELLCPGQASETRRLFADALRLHHVDEPSDYFKRYLWEDLVIDHGHSITTMPDATGMACSLESRNPFLDYKLVEFVMQVDPELLIRARYQNKYLLTEAMRGRIPDSILTRPKMGFSGMTEDQLLRWVRGPGKDIFHDRLLDSKLVRQGYLPAPGVEELWARFSRTPDTRRAVYLLGPIWSAAMLALWYERVGGPR